MTQARQKIAVIGAGISGLASAYFLARRHDVVLYEAGSYIGGHTNTVDVTLEGRTFPVDTGFLVFNEATYPNLIALLDELGVDSYATDMSFGVSQDGGRLEWAGTNLDTVFAQRRRLLSPAFLGMLRDILRFNRAAESNLAASLAAPASLEQLLVAGRYGAMFRDTYLLPMAAAIWSSAPADILQFPAATFLRFCINHGLLQVNDRPQWRTVKGGAREYVRKIVATLPTVRSNTQVRAVLRGDDVVVIDAAALVARLAILGKLSRAGSQTSDERQVTAALGLKLSRRISSLQYHENQHKPCNINDLHISALITGKACTLFRTH